MWNVRREMFASLILLTCAAIGCGKAAPAPAVAPAPVGTAAPGTVTTSPPPGATQQGNATTVASGTTGGPSGPSDQISLSIQQRLLAIGAKRNQSEQSGEVTKNDLKQIGLAFHNIHDVMSAFPAPNGQSVNGEKPAGLSWRVTLLPYLEEGALYQEFHLDEPWDSEHNKALIPRMPKVFGVNAEGKTRVHVLTGKGAPFQNDQATRIRDMIDGTSNTILALVGGADTAEIWTKPGGREFDAQEPFKCLGNVGDRFLAVMMDGSVANFAKSMGPAQFAALAQNADGTPVARAVFERSGSKGSGSEGGGKITINPPVTPLGPTSAKIDLNFIPADAFLVGVAHPRRAYSHPVVKSVREQLPEDFFGRSSGNVPYELRYGLSGLTEMRENLGIAAENIDEVVVVLDKGFPEALMNNPFGVPPFGVVIRNSAPLDVDGIVAMLTKESDGVSIVEHEGVAMVLGPAQEKPMIRSRPSIPPPPTKNFRGVEKAPIDFPTPNEFPEKATREIEKVPTNRDESPAEPKEPSDPCQAETEETLKAAPAAETPAAETKQEAPVQDRIAVAFISDSVVLLGGSSTVRKMISARTSAVASSPVAKQLEALGNPLLAVAVDARLVEKPLKNAVKQMPVPVTLFSSYIVGVKAINLTWDLDSKEFLNLSTEFKNPELASGLFGVLDGQFQQLKASYAPGRAMLESNPSSKALFGYTDQIVNETKFTNSGNVLSFVVPQIKNLDQLPIALKPAIDNANEAAASIKRKNNLKQIGLCFHNYHETRGHLPALNGTGDKGKPGAGLSWRVYLLPFMDGNALYEKFHLDEPWDSEHNKTLIKEMPIYFGTNPEGKTTIHVFTGPNTPFQNDVGAGFAQFRDGLSNTILAVEAGPETAEIWTKPTGLTIDPTNPLKCLGTIAEYYILLGDGSVRRVKDMDAENFLRAVHFNDGMPVRFPN